MAVVANPAAPVAPVIANPAAPAAPVQAGDLAGRPVAPVAAPVAIPAAIEDKSIQEPTTLAKVAHFLTKPATEDKGFLGTIDSIARGAAQIVATPVTGITATAVRGLTYIVTAVVLAALAIAGGVTAAALMCVPFIGIPVAMYMVKNSAVSEMKAVATSLKNEINALQSSLIIKDMTLEQVETAFRDHAAANNNNFESLDANIRARYRDVADEARIAEFAEELHVEVPVLFGVPAAPALEAAPAAPAAAAPGAAAVAAPGAAVAAPGAAVAAPGAVVAHVPPAEVRNGEGAQAAERLAAAGPAAAAEAARRQEVAGHADQPAGQPEGQPAAAAAAAAAAAQEGQQH